MKASLTAAPGRRIDMGNPGKTPPEANFLDRVTWIDKADYERTKSKAYAASTTATGIKSDITLLKAELTGFTALSIGYSLFKIDEKGISYRGKMLYAAKYADMAKHLQVKTERLEEKTIKDHAKLETQVSQLAELRAERSGRESAAQEAVGRRNEAARIHRDYPHETSGENLRAAEAEVQRTRQEVEKNNRQITVARRQARASLAELRKTAKKAKEQRETFTAEKERLQKGSEDIHDSLDAIKNSINGVSAAAAGP
ncbi:hypothetical protein [Streptomyces sp. NPDC055400]